ncbi:uncharacterized protein V1513DRAFT_290883 [Lipomyces chichibuensis]|uniref:uncharacterized protein n=1 Tax=Lipomyces chichibuensis TaxID=1546026 RepID=UPI0033438DDB
MRMSSKALLNLLQGKTEHATSSPTFQDPAVSIARPAPAANPVKITSLFVKSNGTTKSPIEEQPKTPDGELKPLLKPTGSGNSSSTAPSPAKRGIVPEPISEPEATPVYSQQSSASSSSSKLLDAKPRFTYANPFHDLEAKSPLRKLQPPTPISKSATGSSTNLKNEVVPEAPPEPATAENTEATDATSLPLVDPAITSSGAIKLPKPTTVDAVESQLVETVVESQSPVQAPESQVEVEEVPAGFRLPLQMPSIVSIESLSESGSISVDHCEAIANFTRDCNAFDRNILAVNEDFIAYPVGSGIRVLSQEDGTYTVLVGHEDNRIINVLFSNYRSSSGTSMLVSTTASNEVIVWELLTKNFKQTPRQNHYRKLIRIEKLPPNSEHVPKSRVHWPTIAGCVAVAISKRIYIFPLNPETFYDIRRASLPDRVGENAVVIESETGSKDFIFSVDGTAIASVNKEGTATIFDVSKLPPLGQGAEKATITYPLKAFTPRKGTRYMSINFIDSPEVVRAKKPLRFLLFGFNQNHSFHIWDLRHGRIVEEFHLPQGLNGSSLNGVSISYGTGMIVVSDVERNMFVFLHIKYPSGGIDAVAANQAEFIKSLLSQPVRAESEAIGFDYVVEYSFFPGRSIISFSLLEITGEDALLDLYICHDQGATIFPVSAKTIAFGSWSKANPLTSVSIRALEGVHETATPVVLNGSKDASELVASPSQSRPVKKHSIVPFGAMKAKFASAAGKTPLRAATAVLAVPGAVSTPTKLQEEKEKDREKPKKEKPLMEEEKPIETIALEQLTSALEEKINKKRGVEDISAESISKPVEKKQELEKSADAGKEPVDEEKPSVEAGHEIPASPVVGITVPTSGFSFRPVTAAKKKRKEILTRESASALGLPPPAADAAESPAPAPIPKESTSKESTSKEPTSKELTAKEPTAKERPVSPEKDKKPEQSPAKGRGKGKEKQKAAATDVHYRTSTTEPAALSISEETIKIFAESITKSTTAAVEKAINSIATPDLQSLLYSSDFSKSIASNVNNAVSSDFAEAVKDIVSSAVTDAMAKQDQKLDAIIAALEEIKQREKKMDILSEVVKGLL